MPSAFYVTAMIDAGTPNRRVSYLLGPFTGPRAHMAALRMVMPASRAANRTSDPRFGFAAFGTAKISGQRFPPGRLDLSLIEPGDIIAASTRQPGL